MPRRKTIRSFSGSISTSCGKSNGRRWSDSEVEPPPPPQVAMFRDRALNVYVPSWSEIFFASDSPAGRRTSRTAQFRSISAATLSPYTP